MRPGGVSRGIDEDDDFPTAVRPGKDFPNVCEVVGLMNNGVGDSVAAVSRLLDRS